jgi:hypothetical protein
MLLSMSKVVINRISWPGWTKSSREMREQGWYSHFGNASWGATARSCFQTSSPTEVGPFPKTCVNHRFSATSEAVPLQKPQRPRSFSAIS